MNFETAKRIKDRHEDDLMDLDFVQGVGLRKGSDSPIITVYVDEPDTHHRIPEVIEGVPVQVETSGVFEAQPVE